MLNILTLKPIAFGLDISDLSLKLAKLKPYKTEFDLASFNEEAIPPGIIEAGEIKNEETLAEIIKKAVSNVRGERLNTNNVVVCLPEEKAFLRVIQLPKMSIEDLEKAIPFEAENHIPIPLKEAYLDYEIIEPLVDHLDHFDILIAASPQRNVDSYVRTLKMAGLTPVALEAESLSAARALIKDWLSVNPVLLVDFGATRTSLIIFSGKSLRFTSLLQTSSVRLTEALAVGLGVKIEEAEKIKTGYGLNPKAKIRFQGKDDGEDEFGKEVFEDKKVQEILSAVLLEMVVEIKNLLDFYYAHSGHEHLSPSRHEIKKVLLSGGGANLPGLDKFLSKELGISAIPGNPWVNILSEPDLRIPEAYLKRSLSYTNALGLALRGIIGD